MEDTKKYQEAIDSDLDELLILKMRLSRSIGMYKTVKIGILSAIGAMSGQLLKVLFSAAKFAAVEYILFILLIYATYVFTCIEAHILKKVAHKELLIDVLGIRLNRGYKVDIQHDLNQND